MGDWRKGMPAVEFQAIKSVIPISKRTINFYIQKGVDFKVLCNVLIDNTKTTREKKIYVYSLEELDMNMRDVIWAKFNRDRLHRCVSRIHEFQPLYLYEKE